ncbi:uncharacterized protein LOC134190726 isoform X2 [Corticium candelabrum]|uniref:uncharacterized protein LOC134190726 isoform X2 n=1 Tax=Corticium candelabrum TaxID=121492 RepID=UPI002E2573E9|nr:uncharacterized protein LOC134190726 isoform X2 [Corticium candelabrum]
MQTLQHQRQSDSHRPPAPILRLESEEPVRGQMTRYHSLQTSQRQLVPRQRPLIVSHESRQMEVERATVQEVDAQQVGERSDLQIQRVSQIHMSVFRDLSKYEQERASTKMMLDEKERQLMETVKTAEQQKKNMIDLQLKCEKLSSMLQNEQTSQQEIQHRIYATKQLCGALKEQANRLADSVCRGEGDRDELRLQERQLLDQHDELLTKFRELDVSQRKKHDELKKRCNEQEIQLKEQEHLYTTSLRSMELKLSCLDDKCAEQSEQLRVMSSDLQQELDHCSSLQREKSLLKEQLKKTETVKSSQEDTMKALSDKIKDYEVGNAEMTEKITALTTQLRDAETEISRKSCEYTQAQAQYQAAARVLEDNIALRTADLHNSRERTYSLENELNGLHGEMKDLRESLDSAHSQKLEADQFIAELLKKNEVQELQVHDLSDQLSVVSKNRDSALTDVNVLVSEKCGLESKVVELESSITGLIDRSALLEKQLSSHTGLLREREAAVSKLTNDLEVALSNQKTTSSELNNLRQQQEKDSDKQSRVAKILNETETEKEQLAMEVMGIKEALIDLKSELETSKEGEIDLRNQLEIALLGNDQLKATTEEIGEQLNSARQESGHYQQALIKFQEQDLALANEKAANLANEVHLLKEKLQEGSSYVATLDSKISELLADKQQLQADVSSLNESLEVAKAQFAQTADHLAASEQQRVLILEQKDKAVSDLKKAQHDFELQMNELCRTVEQYKEENHRTIQQKEREVVKLDQLRADQDKEHVEVAHLRSCVDTLNKELEDIEQAKRSALDELESGRELIKQLRIQLETKKEVDKMKQLNHQRPVMLQHRDCIVPSTPKPCRPNLRQATTPRNTTPKSSSIRLESVARPRSILKPLTENTLQTASQSKAVAFIGCASPTSSEATEDGLLSPLSTSVPAKKAKSQSARDPVIKSQTGKRQTSSIIAKKSKSPQVSVSTNRSHSIAMRKDKPSSDAVEYELTLFKELFPEAEQPARPSKKFPIHRPRQILNTKLNKKQKLKPREDDAEWNDPDSVFRFTDED